jgi:parallel beta-helix repeat protein
MSGNCLDDHLRHGVVIENTYGSVVAANMIEECVGTAIIMDRDCYGNTVSANVIAHNGAGIDLVDAHGCSLSANTFTIMKTHAIRIRSASGRISVGGNSFSSSYIGDGMLKRGTDDMDAAGIRLESTSEIVISGNQFSGLKPAAVSLGGQPSKRIVFSNNVITDSASEHGQLRESINSNNLEPGK